MEKTKEIIDYLKFSTKLRVLRYAEKNAAIEPS
jgi:hypothetical protein